MSTWESLTADLNLAGVLIPGWQSDTKLYFSLFSLSLRLKKLELFFSFSTIFTISGEEVVVLDHDIALNQTNDSVDGGNHWWNLRTMNNQEVAPGLYIYAVEDLTEGNKNKKCIGKFSIVR